MSDFFKTGHGLNPGAERKKWFPRRLSTSAAILLVDAEIDQEFFIPFGSQKRRLDRPAHIITQFCRGGLDLVDDPRMLRHRPHYATLADFAFADFELRLDESNNFMARLGAAFLLGAKRSSAI